MSSMFLYISIVFQWMTQTLFLEDIWYLSCLKEQQVEDLAFIHHLTHVMEEQTILLQYMTMKAMHIQQLNMESINHLVEVCSRRECENNTDTCPVFKPRTNNNY